VPCWRYRTCPALGAPSISQATECPAQRGNWKLNMTGDRKLEANLTKWLKLSPFAKIEKVVA
jgi:hypothetical protein